MTRRISLALTLVALSACQWGLRPSRYPPATTPEGAQVAVRVHGERVDRIGELYGANAEGIDLFDGHELVQIAWRSIDAMDVDRLGADFDVSNAANGDPASRLIPADKIARLASVSRFGGRLEGERLTRVLRALRQDSVQRVSRVELDRFTRQAERAAARYVDRNAAIADGYRRIGVDFPSMGEHWIRPNALLSGVVDSMPSLLTYARVDGAPTLLGIGYLTTTDGNAAADVPGWPWAWHEHSGLLAEESGARDAREHTQHSAPGRTHVWVLHVWSRLVNPSGRYVADNWTLPFARAGLSAPAEVDVPAARALSLMSGGDGYILGVLGDAGLLARGADQELRVRSAIADERGRVATAVQANMSSPIVSSATMAALRESWARLVQRLVADCGDAALPLLMPAHDHSTVGH
jgi:hypothetical protein